MCTNCGIYIILENLSIWNYLFFLVSIPLVRRKYSMTKILYDFKSTLVTFI